MRRKQWIPGALLVLLCCSSLPVYALSGKISGTVVDAQTNQPLVGASVVIEGILRSGTLIKLEPPRGAACDQDGFYYIINLSPDKYVIKAMMIGYETRRITDVRVETNRTITINFVLNPAVLEGETITVEAKKEVVKLDVSSSESLIDQENSASLPVNNIEEILTLAPGVSIDQTTNSIQIRGGGSDQVMAYLDGFSMKDEIFNVPFLSYNRTSIKEVSIKTGGFLAEYGDLRSGIIDVTTETGSDRYALSVDSRYEPPDYRYYGSHQYTEDKYYLMYGSDWSMDTTILRQKFDHPEDQFMGWPDYAKQYMTDRDSTNDLTPAQQREVWRWQHRGREEGNVHNHVLDATFSGPVPGANLPFIGKNFLDKLNFMVSFRDQFDSYAHPAVRDHFGLQNRQLKLTYKPTSNILLTFMGMQSLQSGMGKFEEEYGEFAYILRQGGEGTYNNTNNPIGDITTNNYGLSFKHVLSENTFYELRLNRISTDYNFRHGPVRDSTIVKIIPGEYYTVADGDTLEISGYWDPRSNQYIGRDTTLVGGDRMWCPPVYLDETPDGWPPYGAGLKEPDQTGRINLLSSSNSTELSSGWTTNVRGDLTHQANRYHLLKAGFSFNMSKIARDWIKVTNALNEEWSQVKFTEFPIYYAAYVQDRIEMKGLIANFGLRGEVFDANAEVMLPDDPFNDIFFEMGFKDRADSIATETSKKYFRLSPRLGISHPITSSSKIFFNYGHAYSSPKNSLRYGFKPKSYDWARPRWIGNPNLKPYKTIQYELGYEQALLATYLLHGAIYYKDVSDQSGIEDRVSYFKAYTTDTQAFYYSWENKNFQDIIGVELTLYKRLGKFFTGWIKTEFMGVKNGQIGYSKLYVEDDPNNVSTYTKYTYPDDIIWDWRPTFLLNLDFHTPTNWGPRLANLDILGGWTINTIINWQAGSKFTWSPDNDPSVYNNMQHIDYFMNDFHISRMFRFHNLKPVFYLNLHNLFNRKVLNYGILRGLINNEESETYKYLNSLKAGDRVGDYEQSYLVRPAERPGEDYITYYGGPVQITFGLKFDFDW
jgi:outer membrane receptor protein involved in Fe transport